MKIIYSLIKKELATFFNSLAAYIILILFLGFVGFFTWLYSSNVFYTGQASLGTFFHIANWVIFFFVPAITMKMFAEEKRTGTIELLLAMPLNDKQVVIGKFLASLLLIVIALVLTFPYVITLANLGNLDNGGTIIGYFGLFLVAAMYASIGIYTSSLTNNQIVAFLLTLFITIFFHLIFGLIGITFGGTIGSMFSFLGVNSHLGNLYRGVINTRDLIYFGSIIVLGLALSEHSLGKRKLSE